MKRESVPTILPILAILALLAPFAANAAGANLRAGLAQSAAQITALGIPSEKSAWEWSYPPRDGTQLILSWTREGTLARAETRFEPPRLVDEAIPARERLVDHPLDAAGGDFHSSERYVGDPTTGQVWKILADGKVGARILVAPWKSSQKPKDVAALLKSPPDRPTSMRKPPSAPARPSSQTPGENP